MKGIAGFALASLGPAPLLAAGALAGGPWPWAALASVTVFAFGMDALRPGRTGTGAAEAGADALSVLLAVVHFPVLALVVWALSGAGGLSVPGWGALFLAAGLWFGQVGNANAHELIHRGDRRLHRLGKWVYISLLFGHHNSAHLLVHHPRVATPRDPNSAPVGMSFYRFLPRAWIGSFRAGLEAENARRARAGKTGGLDHPYLHYVAGGLGFVAVAFALGGLPAVAAYLLLCGHAQTQLLLSDYVQHYGLARRTGPDGRPEPVAARHSWNAPHWYTSLMMLNAPRHSDHHAHPARPYPALRLEGDGPVPMLPRSLPRMAMLALAPRRWRRLMDPAVAAWREPAAMGPMPGRTPRRAGAARPPLA